MKRKYDLYLNDILEAIERVQDYTQNIDLEDFAKSPITIDAVMRNLEIIGEAATQLPKNVKETNKKIPWKDIQDFRIVVAHKYWKINIERVWDIVENKIEPLKEHILRIPEDALKITKTRKKTYKN